MKPLVLFLFVLISFRIYSQNPFFDGIHTTKIVEYKEGTNKYSLFGFKVSVPDEQSINYTFTQHITTPNSNFTFQISATWKWKDIATIEEDTIKNELRLNGHGCIILNKLDMDTKESTEDACNDMVTIYYKDKATLQSALKWAYDYINKLGGKAIIIN